MLTNCQKPHFIEANLLNTEILFLQEFYNPPELPDGIFLFLKMHILVFFFLQNLTKIIMDSYLLQILFSLLIHL